MDGSPKHYVSSYRGNSTVQQMKHLEDIVHDLAKMDDAWPFLKPVSKKMVICCGQTLFQIILYQRAALETSATPVTIIKISKYKVTNIRKVFL